MPVPDGLKPYDPKGPMSQVDSYMDGLPENDEIAASVRMFKNLRVAVDKLASEHKAVCCTVTFLPQQVECACGCQRLKRNDAVGTQSELRAQAGPSKPPGMVSLADGSVDEEFYSKTQGIHPSFVTGLKSIMQGK
jgi:hypothetical protein